MFREYHHPDLASGQGRNMSMSPVRKFLVTRPLMRNLYLQTLTMSNLETTGMKAYID